MAASFIREKQPGRLRLLCCLVLAALMLAIGRRLPTAEALRFAAAAAGASVMRPGTLLCRRADQEALLPGLTVSTL